MVARFTNPVEISPSSSWTYARERLGPPTAPPPHSATMEPRRSKGNHRPLRRAATSRRAGRDITHIRGRSRNAA